MKADTNLTHGALEEAVQRWGDRTALEFKDSRYSFRELHHGAMAVAAALAELGVSEGDRVAVYMENRPGYIMAYYGVPSMGAVLVPMNNFLAIPELRTVLEDCRPGVLVTSVAGLKKIGSLLKDLPWLDRLLVFGPGAIHREFLAGGLRVARHDDTSAQPSPAAAPVPDTARDPSRPAVIIYTSGTTGTPKGVMLSHRNLVANAGACVEAVGVTAKDKILVCLPLFHSFTATVGMLAPIVSGMVIILCERLERADVRRTIARARPTIFPAVPAVFTAMSLARVGLLSRWLNPIRLYISGGAPLPLETLERFEKLYRRPLCEGYGLSEAAPVVCLNPPRGPRKPGAVGLPLPGVSVRVLDGSGREVPTGETGELAIRGPNVMLGYFGKPEETSAVLRDGFLMTGDMARIDADGYVFIMGRSKEMLIHRGMNVYPREIEQVLEAVEGVKEAAVVGLDDPARGEVPCAFVVAQPGTSLSESALRRACTEKLARYKVPRVFRIVQDLPRNATGKVLKQELKQRAAAQPSG